MRFNKLMSCIKDETYIQLLDEYNEPLETRQGPKEISCKYYSKKILLVEPITNDNGTTYLKIVIRTKKETL